MDSRIALLPTPSPSAILVGDVPAEVKEDSSLCEWMKQLQPLKKIIKRMEKQGIEEEYLQHCLATGTLIQFPSSFTVEDFDLLFSGLRITSQTGNAVLSRAGDIVQLATPNYSGIIPTSHDFYDMLISTTLQEDLPQAIQRASHGRKARKENLIREVSSLLRVLLKTGTARLEWANNSAATERRTAETGILLTQEGVM